MENKKLIFDKKKILVYVIFGFILLINLIGIIASVTNNSLILKIKPINRVYIFAHGEYVNLSNGEYFHVSTIDGVTIITYNLLEELRKEGYNYIWISMCEQGNSDYVIDYGNGTKIEWGDDVSRVKNSGTVHPIFFGLGIYRLTFKEQNGGKFSQA